MTQPCQGPDPRPKKPALAAPTGSCDTHFHIFGPAGRFAYQADRSYTPPDASVESYVHLCATLGVERHVIIQPSVYGTDNRCTLDAMQRLGPQCRAVAVIDESFTDDDLDALDAAGVRGIRFNLLFLGGTGMESLEDLSRRVAHLGWHVQLLLDGRDLPDLAGRLRNLPLDIVIDHMGHAPASLGIDHPANRAMLDLVDGGRCWVKLSGAYRISAETVPYRDVLPLARALADAGPDRMLWGSDWPHPSITCPMPNDGDLLDLLADWVPDPAARQKVLVDNPAALYGFD